MSYCAQLGIAEGLAANNVKCVAITTPWLERIQEIVDGKHFDQVWVELVHTKLDEVLLAWIVNLAPVRVGFLLESLDYHSKEYDLLPLLKTRKVDVERKIKYMTHVVTCDEKDADDFNASRLAPAIWWPQAVPKRFICPAPATNRGGCAIFSGALYGERANWMKHPDLKKLLVRQHSSEHLTPYPLCFDIIHAAIFVFLKSRLPGYQTFFPKYMDLLFSIRGACFALWLKSLQKGCAVVNLPHLVKTYAGRVVEGMAAGQPVISWEIPDRPRNKALFEDGVEILLFNKDDPGQLVEQIQRLRSDHALSRKITTNALKKLERFHTIEKRIEQILDWIEKGDVPHYG